MNHIEQLIKLLTIQSENTLRANPPIYMNARESAEYLNFSKSLFDKEIRHLLPAYKFGKRINYHLDDLNKFMESLRIEPRLI